MQKFLKTKAKEPPIRYTVAERFQPNTVLWAFHTIHVKIPTQYSHQVYSYIKQTQSPTTTTDYRKTV